MNDNKENVKATDEVTPDTTSPSEHKSQYTPAIITGTITAALFVIYFWWFREHPPGDPESWGDFGDFIGGLMNPVVGIVTIVLLVRTLNSQREDSKQSAQVLAEQHRAIQIQSFEQTLFKWLDSYKQSITEIRVINKVSDIETKLVGLEAVEYIYSSAIKTPKALRAHFNGTYSKENWLSLPQSLIEETNKSISTRVGRIHAIRKNANLTRSIRLIYGLLRFIDTYPALEEEQKQKYANIIRAHLSEDELTILFYYGLTPAGDKLVKYINKLAIFDNFLGSILSITVPLLSEESPYTAEAFGDRTPLALRIRALRAHKIG